MDLTNLRDSLDSSSRERHPAMMNAKKSEVRLTRDFKAAAMQLTTLYRTSLSSAKRSYAAGYAQSLTDILDVVLLRLQQDPDTAPGAQRGPARVRADVRVEQEAGVRDGRNREELEWLVRYMRARIEAIRAECEEEEDADESEDDDGVEDANSQANDKSIMTDNKVQSRSNGPTRQERHTHGNAASTPLPSMHSADDEVRMDRGSSPASTRQTSVPSSAFTFGASTSSQPSKRRARNANASAQRSPSQLSQMQPLPPSAAPPANGGSQPHALSPSISPSNPFVRALSSSSEEETSLRHHPHPTASNRPPPSNSASSRRSRLGKRYHGREKLSGLDFFARSLHAKRRRGAGDRRDDESDDALL